MKKIDKNMLPIVKAMLASGRWALKEGSKHVKMCLLKSNAVVVVAGSSSDPKRALLNFRADVRRAEKLAQYETTSI